MLAKAKREVELQRELLMTKSLPGLVDDQSTSSVTENNESDSESDTESDKSELWSRVIIRPFLNVPLSLLQLVKCKPS